MPAKASFHRCGRRGIGTAESTLALVENTQGGPATQASSIQTSWDDDAWHVRFACTDANPWATISTRDAALWTEEVVEVFVDPVGDLQSYFEIEVNPLNTVCDLVLRRIASGWRREFAWHCDGLETAVRLTETGWTAELRIPFAALVEAPPPAGAIWRVNFFRIDRPAGPASEAELSAWSPTLAPTFHRPARFGFLEFD